MKLFYKHSTKVLKYTSKHILVGSLFHWKKAILEVKASGNSIAS